MLTCRRHFISLLQSSIYLIKLAKNQIRMSLSKCQKGIE